ncbi:MAG TPA: phosphoglycerate mutase family protein, partial [Myxococcota bacterium]|nr:phosphoglycerate mutase family protein [Myxococcota bacterium]
MIAIAPPGKEARPKPQPVQQSIAARPDRKQTVSRYILIRHCEKAGGETDPGLTARGQERAQALVGALEQEKVDAIYSTPYKRTQATVKPLAAAHRLNISIIEGTNDKAFAKRLLSDHKGQSVVIASHINVIPDLVKLLGVQEKVTLDEGAYGDMFIVDI